MQVVEHVPYEGKGSSDSVQDDVLGVSYAVKKVEQPVQQEEVKGNNKPTFESDEDLDESLPF